MANLSSIARPYALAAFEHAQSKKHLSEWKTFLESAATLTKHPMMQEMLNNPQMSAGNLVKIYSALLSMQDEAQKNFLHLLAQHNRFIALPEIAEAYFKHYTALQKSSTVRVITAVEATPAFQESLAKALTKRTQRDIILECDTNPDIIGGAIIYLGDRVIDGSIRGKLNRLLETLTD